MPTVKFDPKEYRAYLMRRQIVPADLQTSWTGEPRRTIRDAFEVIALDGILGPLTLTHLPRNPTDPCEPGDEPC